MPSPIEPSPAEEYVHEVDSRDRIVAVNESWLQFAQENGAADLTLDAVLGRSLWDFLSCAETKAIYRTLFQCVRAEQKEIPVPYRCDAPDQRRFMVNHLSPLPQGGIRMSNRIVRIEYRQPVAWRRITQRLADRLTLLCSWCKRVHLPSGEWVEIEAATRQFGFESDLGARALSHGICPKCETTWLESLGL